MLWLKVDLGKRQVDSNNNRREVKRKMLAMATIGSIADCMVLVVLLNPPLFLPS